LDPKSKGGLLFLDRMEYFELFSVFNVGLKASFCMVFVGMALFFPVLRFRSIESS